MYHRDRVWVIDVVDYRGSPIWEARRTCAVFALTAFTTTITSVGYPFDSGSHKMLWSRESIYQEANPEVTALARRGAA